jgi:hypothetical protein
MSERRYSEEVVMKVKRDIMATGKGYAQIGRENGMPANTVREISLGNSYPDVGVFVYPLRPVGKRRGAKVSDIKVKGVGLLLDKGCSIREISRLTGVARATVAKMKRERDA